MSASRWKPNGVLGCCADRMADEQIFDLGPAIDENGFGMRLQVGVRFGGDQLFHAGLLHSAYTAIPL